MNTLGKVKVLLAEDNEINKLIVKVMLQHWGFEISQANNGVEAVDLVNQEDFDVILMDIQMPEKDGIEATIDIRNMADERKKNIPIIALTADALMGEEKKYFDAGMNAYLTKPFKEQTLYETIAQVVSVRQPEA
ncbi:response regulator [Chitinophagaceae bacterium LWZ2-11]